jgi:hypothetical protein
MIEDITDAKSIPQELMGRHTLKQLQLVGEIYG